MQVRSYGGPPLYRQLYDFLRLLKISWHHLIVKKITSGKDLLVSEF